MVQPEIRGVGGFPLGWSRHLEQLDAGSVSKREHTYGQKLSALVDPQRLFKIGAAFRRIRQRLGVVNHLRVEGGFKKSSGGIDVGDGDPDVLQSLEGALARIEDESVMYEREFGDVIAGGDAIDAIRRHMEGLGYVDAEDD